MSLLAVAGANSASGGYEIDNSLKIESDNSESLNRTLGTPTNVDKATFSFWFKRTELGRQWLFSTRQNTSSPYDTFRISITASDQIQVQNYQASYNARIVTNRVFRDTNAWYSIVASIDTTQSTAGDRIKLYVNGVEETSFATEDQPPQNSDLYLESGRILEIGRFIPDQGVSGALYECEGYLAEAHFIDGQQLAPTEFGEFDSDSGIWKPKQYLGTYGDNGHYLKFASSGSLGTDSSGNGNDFTLNNIAAADQASDSPTNSFCTMNVLWSNSYTTYTEGATNVDTTGSGWMSMVSNFAVKSGKWYWEFKSDSGYAFVGITDAEEQYIPRSTAGYFFGHNDNAGTNSIGMYSVNGQAYNSPSGTPDGVGFGTSDIIGVAVDMDNYRLYYHKNGTYAGSMNPSAGSGGITIPTDWNSEYIYMGFSGFNGSYAVNFGGYTTISISSAANDGEYGAFEYAPPSGYYALCTKRLAENG